MRIDQLKAFTLYQNLKSGYVFVYSTAKAPNDEVKITYRIYSPGNGANWSEERVSDWKKPNVDVGMTELPCSPSSIPPPPPGKGTAGVPPPAATPTTVTKGRVIPENKNSKFCTVCKQPTKEVLLFSGSSNYCPQCE